MLFSMTGYGRSKVDFQDKVITVEIRSLNSKYTDLRIKLPNQYKEKEPDIRKLITDRIERGKVDFAIELSNGSGEDNYSLNIPLFKKYYSELKLLSDELGEHPKEITSAILRLPNVVTSQQADLAEEEWQIVLQGVQEALQRFDAFREKEGQVMEADMRERCQIILDLLDQVSPFEQERIEKMRARMQQNMEEFLGRENVDENRFEQEMLFYLEKMDITEEKLRLRQHCDHFQEVIQNDQTQKGKKLSFIGQEIGREINTLGAKAYSFGIQRLVVSMKDELEKIKEQVANSL